MGKKTHLECQPLSISCPWKEKKIECPMQLLQLLYCGDFSYLSTSAGSSLHIYLVKQRDEYLVWPLVNFYLICTLWMLLRFRLGFPLSCLVHLKSLLWLLFGDHLIPQFWAVCITGLINLEAIGSIFGIVLNPCVTAMWQGKAEMSLSVYYLLTHWNSVDLWDTEKQDSWGATTVSTAMETLFKHAEF